MNNEPLTQTSTPVTAGNTNVNKTKLTTVRVKPSKKKQNNPSTVGPRHPRTGDPETGDPKTGDPKTGEPRDWRTN